MIRVEHLVKRYGAIAAVDRLSLDVAAGEIYALLGPNGAGKSTTIGCLLGLIDPDEGRITIAGDSSPDAAVTHAAYIPETVALYDRLTGRENVELFSRLAGRKRNAAERDAFLQRADLPPAAWGKLTGTYSKGMRQKVGIAIALAKDAQALVLDEPTSGLDPEASIEFGRILRGLAEGGKAVLMATHDLFRAQEVAHRCGILHRGRLAGEWRMDALARGDLENLYLERIHAPAR